MRALFQALLGLAWLALALACGKEGDNQTGTLKYFLEVPATSVLTNAFILKVEGEFKPSFSLTGTGFTAEVPFDTITPFQESTALTAETFGDVDIHFTLYQENGKPYLTDKLLWKSSGEKPPALTAYFSEIASADAYVYLVLPKNRGKNTQEVWVEGDLIPSAGKYYSIPSDDQVLLELSPGDGIKNLRAKYRNIFGAHSELVDLKIERKAQGPVACRAIPVASKTASGSIRTRIQASNNGPLFYKVTGDVAIPKDYIEFSDSIEDYIVLTAGEGLKNITVKMKDEAGNACDDIRLAINYDRSYVPGSLTIAGQPIWTDNPAVTVLPHFDKLDGDRVEMYIGGGVATGTNTFVWMPYSESVAINLSPTNGTRHVVIEFRKEQTILAEATASVFLRPYVFVAGTAPNIKVMPGNILGASSLSIAGCAEVYDHVMFQEEYPCTPSASQATVTYYLTDGTSIMRSTPF